MEQLPVYISFIFLLISALAVLIFFIATGRNKLLFSIIIAWGVILSVIGYTGFFTVTDTIPPRFPLLVIPPFIIILVIFMTRKGRDFIDQINIKYLPLLHSLRIGVELVLFWLFQYNMMPQLMTFEGRNFDIISGLTAPFMYYFASKGKLSNGLQLFWNLACFLILLFTVTNGILSVPSVLQQFAFDQPNTAVLYFPFVLLPGIVVPLVLFSHLVSIRQLFILRNTATSAKPHLVSRELEIG